MRFLLALFFCFTVFAADPIADDVIYDKVRLALANDREVKGGAIEVKVSQGVVELIGKVREEKQKVRAEKAARKVKGVQKVNNQLVVAPL